MSGEVVAIANIGQTMPNSDAKVFEVKIKVFGVDKDLKPAMTTSNIVYTNFYKDTLYIPIDAVFENDSMQYVYVDNGRITRQVVRLGESNENYVLVSDGLKQGDVVCLNEPEAGSELPFEGLEIYQAMMEEKEEQRKQAEEERSKADKTKQDEMPAAMSPAPSGSVVISN